MEDMLIFDHVCQYNEHLGQETLHPLVNVIDMSKSKPLLHHSQRFGFYTIFLKDVKCGDMHYGRNFYDYQEGTLVFLAPGQVAGITNNGETFQPKGYALVFHPNLLRGTPLGRTINDYTFFSYESNEALHLSESLCKNYFWKTSAPLKLTLFLYINSRVVYLDYIFKLQDKILFLYFVFY